LFANNEVGVRDETILKNQFFLSKRSFNSIREINVINFENEKVFVLILRNIQSKPLIFNN
jgi:hypothetical protein